MVLFDAASRVWVPDDVEGWAIATVEGQQGGTVTVRTEAGGEVREVRESDVSLVQEESLVDCDDMVKMDDLNEAVLLRNLRQRHARGCIYTLIGTVLVSVNPFRSIPGMYGPEVVQKYVNAEFGQLAPHIYQVAANAYRSLIRSRRSQAILVSGESGAGKTEAAKAILQCLALTSSKGGGGGAMGEIERVILESNPLLEAFGNAQTVCNSNSSRFGKFIKVQFDGNGRISGAVIDTYLLEKSRIVWQAPSERCYHVFYQLLTATSVSARTSQCYLEGMLPEHFHYLNQSGCYAINGVDDRTQFSELETAMSIAGLTEGDIDAVFQTLAVILHLGNLAFEPKPATERKNEDDAVLMISDTNQCDVVAHLLGVDSTRLSSALLTRQFRGASRGSVYAIPLEMPEATEGRDALAKAMYSKLFDWLVARVNQHLSRSTGAGDPRGGAQQMTIGVLDIFGFEIFQHNSFEQLLINFANERLQAEFNKTMFKMEQEEYTREGIDWQQIDFSDNQVCVDVIDKKPFGVLKLLDEECHMPKGSDLKLLDKLRTKHQSSPAFQVPRTGHLAGETFVINHYAGPVSYHIQHFMEKNKDTLPEDLETLVKGTANSFLQTLFPMEEEVPTGGRGRSRGGNAGTLRKTRKMSVSQAFSSQLNSLVTFLGDMDQHYIRCIKPNTTCQADVFEPMHSLRQLRCAGLMDTIRVRKAGFSYRRAFAPFLDRFSLAVAAVTATGTACPTVQDLVSHGDSRDACGQFMGALRTAFPGMFACGWVLGKTKVFLKNEQLLFLEEQREAALRGSVAVLERCFRSFVIRRKWRKAVAQVIEQERVRKEEERRREEERRKKEEEERLRREEEEMKRKAEEERRRREEEELRKHQEAEMQKRQKEEEAKRQEAEQRKLKEEQERQQVASAAQATLPSRSGDPLPAPPGELHAVAGSLAGSRPCSPARGHRGRGQRGRGAMMRGRGGRGGLRASTGSPGTSPARLAPATPPLQSTSPLPRRPEGSRPLPVPAPPPPATTGPPPLSSSLPGRLLPTAPSTPPSRSPSGLRRTGSTSVIASSPSGSRGRGGKGRGRGIARAQSTMIPSRSSGDAPSSGPTSPLPPNLARAQSTMTTSRKERSPPTSPLPSNGRGGIAFAPESGQEVKAEAPPPRPGGTAPPPSVSASVGGSRGGRGMRARGMRGKNSRSTGALPVHLVKRKSLGATPNPRLQHSTPQVTRKVVGLEEDESSPAPPAGAPPTLNKRASMISPTVIQDPAMKAASYTIPKIEFEGTKEEIMRQRTLYELVTTEKDYIGDVAILIDVFLKPIQEKGILKSSEILTMFSNVTTLININMQVLDQLMEKMPTFVETKDLPIGHIFTSMSSYFKVYTTYCVNQPVAFALLEEIQTRKEFANFLKHCEADPRCRGLFLNSFLIKPTQRICKYPLLLRDLLRRTPEDHPDLADLNTAMQKIEEVVDFINERKREVENSQKMIKIQSMVEGMDDLITPARKFLNQMTLSVAANKSKMTEMEVFVFNDIILFTKRKKKWRSLSYEMKHLIEISNARLIVVAETRDNQNQWEMSGKKDSFKLLARTEADKREWIGIVKKLINDYKKLLFSANARTKHVQRQ